MKYIPWVLLTMLVAASCFPEAFSGHSYDLQNLNTRLLLPSFEHWFGTDNLGRDLLARVCIGARISLTVGALTALLALALGVTSGILSGYFGSWIDTVLMRSVDALYVFPSALSAILLSLLFGRGPLGLICAIALTSWLGTARLVRGKVLTLKHELFIDAAKVTGVGTFTILYRHLLPQLWGPILVSLIYQIPQMMLLESFLSFMGLGVQAPLTSWGTLASEGHKAMRSYPHLIILPGIILFLTLIVLQKIGDQVRDAVFVTSEDRLQ